MTGVLRPCAWLILNPIIPPAGSLWPTTVAVAQKGNPFALELKSLGAMVEPVPQTPVQA